MGNNWSKINIILSVFEGGIMLRIIVSVSWLITVVFMWLPNVCKNQLMKDNERQIIKILATISAVLSVCYVFLG